MHATFCPFRPLQDFIYFSKFYEFLPASVISKDNFCNVQKQLQQFLSSQFFFVDSLPTFSLILTTKTMVVHTQKLLTFHNSFCVFTENSVIWIETDTTSIHRVNGYCVCDGEITMRSTEMTKLNWTKCKKLNINMPTMTTPVWVGKQVNLKLFQVKWSHFVKQTTFLTTQILA